MFSICIYKNYNETTLVDTVRTKDISINTSIPEGYNALTFSVINKYDKPMEYWISKHIVVYDFYGDRSFEGLIKNVTKDNKYLKIMATGYYSRCKKVSAGPMYFSGHDIGAMLVVSVSAGGTGYDFGDGLTLTTGSGTGGEVNVDKVDASGVVEEVVINTYGKDYSSVEVSATSGGAGSGCTVSIDVVEVGSTNYDVVTFLVDLSPYFADDYSRIKRLDRIPVGPFNLTRKDNIENVLNQVLEYGYLDTSNYETDVRRPFYFVVYNNRILEMKRLPDIRIDKPDWKISLANIVDKQPLKLSIDVDNLINQVWVEYNDPDLNGSTFTLGEKNQQSINKYGLMQGVISIGEANENVASVVEELVIEEKSKPYYSSTLKVTGSVISKDGAMYPLWRIKAGDLLSIVDLDAGIEGISGERISSVSVVSATRYNNKDNTMDITLGSGKKLDLLLRRLGV